MSLTSIDGRALLLAVILAGVVVLTAAIRRETKQLPGLIDDILDPPEPPTTRPDGGLVRACDGPCRRRLYIPAGHALAVLAQRTWICTRCVEDATAELEKDFAS